MADEDDFSSWNDGDDTVGEGGYGGEEGYFEGGEAGDDYGEDEPTYATETGEEEAQWTEPEEEEEEEDGGVDPAQEAKMAQLEAARQKALASARSRSSTSSSSTSSLSAFTSSHATSAFASPPPLTSAFAAGENSGSAFSAFGAAAPSSPIISTFGATPAAAATSAFGAPSSSSTAAAASKNNQGKNKKNKPDPSPPSAFQSAFAAPPLSTTAAAPSTAKTLTTKVKKAPTSTSTSSSSSSGSKRVTKEDRAARFGLVPGAKGPSASPPALSPSPPPPSASPTFTGGRPAPRSTASLMAQAMGGGGDDHGGDEEAYRAENYAPIIGECMLMCPLEEQQYRQESRDLSYFEMIPGTGSKAHGDVPLVDPSKAVKKYKRAAAAQTLQAKDVRPPHVLKKTMEYLVDHILDRKDSPDPLPTPPFLAVYRFVSDRMRALRQDFVCQGQRDALAVHCYEIMVRFHILTLYELGDLNNLEKFDPTPNMEKLSQTLTSLRHMYLDNYVNKQRAMGTGGAEAAVGTVPPFSTPNEAEMHSYRLLIELNRRFATLYEELDKFDPSVKSAPIIQWCVAVYTAVRENNWARFFTLARAAPYCHAVLLQTHFNTVRQRALEVMASSYISYPFASFVDLLGFEDAEHARSFLEYYGIPLAEGATTISFKRSSSRGGRQVGFDASITTPYPFRNSTVIVGVKRPPTISMAVQQGVGRGEGLGLEKVGIKDEGQAGGAQMQQQQQKRSKPANYASTLMRSQAFIQPAATTTTITPAASASSSAASFGQKPAPSSFSLPPSQSFPASSSSSSFSGVDGSTTSTFTNFSGFQMPAPGSLDGVVSKPTKIRRGGFGAETISTSSSYHEEKKEEEEEEGEDRGAKRKKATLNAKAAPFVPSAFGTTSTFGAPATATTSAFSSSPPAAAASTTAGTSSTTSTFGFGAGTSSAFGAATGASTSFGSAFGSPAPLSSVSAFGSTTGSSSSSSASSSNFSSFPSFGAGSSSSAFLAPASSAAPATSADAPSFGFGATTSTVPAPLSPQSPPAKKQAPAAAFPSFGVPSTTTISSPATVGAGAAVNLPVAPQPTVPSSSPEVAHIAGFRLPLAGTTPPRPAATPSTGGAFGTSPAAAAAAPSTPAAAPTLLPPPHPRRPSPGQKGPSPPPSFPTSFTPARPPSPPPQPARPSSPTPAQQHTMFLQSLRSYRTLLLRRGLKRWLESLQLLRQQQEEQRRLEAIADGFQRTKWFLVWHARMLMSREAKRRFQEAQARLISPAPPRLQGLPSTGSGYTASAKHTPHRSRTPGRDSTLPLTSPLAKLQLLGIEVGRQQDRRHSSSSLHRQPIFDEAEEDGVDSASYAGESYEEFAAGQEQAAAAPSVEEAADGVVVMDQDEDELPAFRSPAAAATRPAHFASPSPSSSVSRGYTHSAASLKRTRESIDAELERLVTPFRQAKAKTKGVERNGTGTEEVEERKEGGEAVPASSRVKLFHTPAQQTPRAIFSSPNGTTAHETAASPSSALSVSAALEEAAAAAASPAIFHRARTSGQFASPSSVLPAFLAAAAASPAGSPPASKPLLQVVRSELKQSSKLDELMQQLEMRFGAH